MVFLLLLFIRVERHQTWLYLSRVMDNFRWKTHKKQFFLKNYCGKLFFTIFVLLFLLFLAICVHQRYQKCFYLCRVKWTVLNEKRTRKSVFPLNTSRKIIFHNFHLPILTPYSHSYASNDTMHACNIENNGQFSMKVLLKKNQFFLENLPGK